MIPSNKIEDFGVHCQQYYQLEVSYFKSSLDSKIFDSLWNKYWVNTLASSGFLSNAEYTTRQIFDLAEKLEQSESSLTHGLSTAEDKLTKVTRDCCQTSMELIHGLIAQITKDKMFNNVGLKK